VDKATGKEQSIKIQASSGLSDEEIDKMVSDAETNADADKQKRELIDVRNEAEARIHSARKSMEELGDDIDASLKEDVETKIKALEEVLGSEDIEMIRAASDAMMESIQQLAAKAYEKASAAQGGGEDQTGPAPEGEPSAETNKKKKDDGSVDADYEVVD